MSAAQGQFLTFTPPTAAWGERRIYKPANPAAGKEFTFTTSQSMHWGLVSFTIRLKTSAQAAKRVPGLEVQDGDGNTLMVFPATQEVPEGVTKRVTFAPGPSADSTIAGAPAAVGIPRLLLLPGYTIATSTTALQTEDEYLGPVLWVEEFEQVQFHPRQEMDAAVRALQYAERMIDGTGR
jgi:hypothetical protein